MTNWRTVVNVCILVVALTWVAQQAWADIGQIKTLTGEVSIIRDNVEQPAKAGDLLKQADTIITGDESSVGITFIDNSRFSAGPRSRIELAQFRFNPTTHEGTFLTKIIRGTLAIISGNIAKRSEKAMKVQTPTRILGVRGTKLLIKIEE